MDNPVIALLPQQPPFIMIGSLLLSDEQYTRTMYTLSADNILLDNGQWTEAGLLENIAQTVAAGAGRRALDLMQPVQVGYIASVKNFEVLRLPRPGEELITEVWNRETLSNMIRVEGSIRCQGTLIASCEMNIFIGPQP